MSTSKQFNRQIEFLSTQPIIGNSGGAVYIAGGLNVSNLNVSNNVTIANLTITNNLFTSTGSTLLSSQWINVPAGISYTSANSNIGIGTTSPGFNLDVSGGARITGGLTVGTLTTIIGASIPNLLSSVITTGSILATNFINSTNITTVNLVANFTSLGNLTSSTGTFANKVGGSQTVGTLVVTTSASLIGNTNTIGSIFTTGGNVGINTTSPGFTLDINGSGRFNNNVTAQRFNSYTGVINITTTGTYNISPGIYGYIGKMSVYIAQIPNGVWGAQGDLIMPANQNIRGNLSNITQYQYSSNQISATLQPFGGSNNNGFTNDNPSGSVQVVVTTLGAPTAIYWTLTIFSSM